MKEFTLKFLMRIKKTKLFIAQNDNSCLYALTPPCKKTQKNSQS